MTAVADPDRENVSQERQTLAVAGSAHALHDGYTDLILVLLPVWQAEFGLSYAETGVLRSVFTGTMAAFQLPATWLAGKLGLVNVLAAGTALGGFGYILAGLSGLLPALFLALFAAGLGSSTQHPLASSLVARAFAGRRSLQALGTYNFAGDLGKMTVPAAAALLMLFVPWRPTVSFLGLLGLAAAVAIMMLTPKLPEDETFPAKDAVGGVGRAGRWGFPCLFTIGMIDSATRMGFLLFLPFLLAEKGASLPTVGIALTLVFAGGAAGKLVCAFVGARIGVIATVLATETLTAAVILLVLPLSLAGVMALLPLLGIALNGTSSVLYGSVPVLVTPRRRAAAFGLFYTGTIGAGAAAPVMFGALGDAFGMHHAIAVAAAAALLTLPVALALRPCLAATPRN